MKEKLKVGQKLWLVPDRWSKTPAREITITTVGRKWATGDNVPFSHRIDAFTWVPETINGFASAFCLYESKQHHDEEVKLNLAQALFKSNVEKKYRDFTLQQISAASDAPGIEKVKP